MGSIGNRGLFATRQELFTFFSSKPELISHPGNAVPG